MFKKILIANRGEIAVRILRSCREMGISSVAVYSEPDREALHVRYGDEAYCIGPGAARESYLVIDKIIGVAKRSGAEAIHPGYGFLSENAEFAERCEAEGIAFIGPRAETIRDMGSKVLARQTMEKAGVPIVPGTTESLSDEEIAKAAEKIGYPIMLKATAGGGGKGLRAIQKEKDLAKGIPRARGEVRSAFGDDALYIEKLIERPRHVEVQVIGDHLGNVIHIGDRECTIQRRHQKVIEESPATCLDPAARKDLWEAGVRAAEAVGYRSAGTIEFLYDEAVNKFYFLEVNTRLQVEHPVTELRTGIDIVKLQIRIAAGERLPIAQSDVQFRGAAIECRIYAEDPEKNFFPSPGLIRVLREPSGPFVRCDSGVFEGYEVPLDYDPLISKLCAWGHERAEAIDRMRRALSEFVVKGIRTTIPFHLAVMEHEKFLAGEFTTRFIDEQFSRAKIKRNDSDREVAVIAAAVAAFRRGGRSRPQAGAQGDRKGSPWREFGRRRGLR